MAIAQCSTDDLLRRLVRKHAEFDTHIFQALRSRGYGVKNAFNMSCLECCGCGGPADHWHTMTGTTLDDRPQGLWGLLEGCTLVGNMACGHSCELSLETGEYYLHCEDCDEREAHDDDEDDDDDEDE